MDTKEREHSGQDATVRCPDAYLIGNEDCSFAFCSINDKPCLRESGLECDYYNEYLEEIRNED